MQREIAPDGPSKHMLINSQKYTSAIFYQSNLTNSASGYITGFLHITFNCLTWAGFFPLLKYLHLYLITFLCIKVDLCFIVFHPLNLGYFAS